MTTQKIFILIGITLNMVGAYLMYHYTPKVNSQLYLYTQAETHQFSKKDQFKNKMIRLGMLLLFIGFIFQFAALFITC